MTEEEFLANQIDYLEAGIHIATKMKSPGMKKFIYKTRDDGLYLLDLKTIDSRIRIASKMIAAYNPKDVVVTASRIYAIVPAQKFAEITNATFLKGRVTPGIFTNPNRENFMEPKLILISDSRNEKQAIKEASKISMPIIALSDTDNSTKYIDLVLPVNNRGRRSLAFVYYLMAREVLKERGTIKSNEEFKFTISDFEAKVDATAQQPGGERYQRNEDHGNRQAEIPQSQRA
jgi:small subunit ribosomal protein S2